MIWAVLVLVGVPLWLCAVAVTALVLRNRGLRRRHGDLPVRVPRPGRTRWTRGHALWVSDVFAWRGSPASWTEGLLQVTSVTVRDPDPAERRALRRLGGDAGVAVLTTATGGTLLAAVAADHRVTLPGPFLAPAETVVPRPRSAAGD